MPTRRFSLQLALAAALVVVPTFVGCSHNNQARVAHVEPGSMPGDARWDGVYFNPLFGYLHLVEAHGQVKGRWLRPQKDKWGELQGDVTEDVVHFTWTEYVTDGFGPNAKKQGKGYFHYQRPEGSNVDDVLEGAMGPGDNELGTAWKSVKQRNVDPDLDSVGPGARPGSGGSDWDGNGPRPEEPKAEPDPQNAEESKPAAPEPPKPPKAKGKTKGRAKP